MSAGRTSRRCLVTGGAGFIGSYLCESLCADGHQVTVVDNLSTGRRSNLDAVEDRITFLHGNLTDRLGELDPGSFDEIYHLAAAVGVRLVVEQPIHTIETNVHETSSILAFASRSEASILIASTSEVYGKGVRTPFSEDDDVLYGPTTISRWSYACSKAIDEYLALAHHREHGLPAVVVRFFNTVGPRQVGEYGMVLPRFVEAALDDRPLQVHGDGRQSRCFCDVRDVVPSLPALVRNATCHGRVFNVGSDEPIEIGALATLVLDTLESSSPIVNVPYDEAFSEGFEDLLRREPDLRRIRDAIGFERSIPLQRTIRDLAERITAERRVLRAGDAG